MLTHGQDDAQQAKNSPGAPSGRRVRRDGFGSRRSVVELDLRRCCWVGVFSLHNARTVGIVAVQRGFPYEARINTIHILGNSHIG